MSKEEIIRAFFELPVEERDVVIGEILHRVPEMEPASTVELIAELDRRHERMISNPDEEMSWEEVCAELDQEQRDRDKSTGS